MEKVGIHSVPRSGSTWLGAIFDSSPNVAYRMQPLFSFEFKDFLDEKSSPSRVDKFFAEIMNSNSEFVLQKPGKRSGLVPEFIKTNTTHICYKEVRYHHILSNLLAVDAEIKIIGLIRNPFGVINSWLKAPKEFKAEWNWKIEQEWRLAPSKNLNKPEEFNGFEKWKEVLFLFLKLEKEYPERFCLVQYENLLMKPIEEVKKLFSFVDLEFAQQTVDFIKDSQSEHNPDSYSVYKQKSEDDAWKNELPSYISEEIIRDKGFQMLNSQFNWLKK